MMGEEMSKDARAANEVSRAIARIQSGVLTVAFAAICGSALFVMTAWLVIKGGPHVGQHLELLRQYFPGYSVTTPGAFLGFLYAFVVGYVLGRIVGRVYNLLTPR